MFPPDLTKAQMLSIIEAMSEEDFARFRYVQEMAGTYLSVAHFEDMLIDAMNMCDRVKVRHALGDDADRWEAFKGKRTALQGSTLGSLISILDRHAVSADDLRYLKWIKGKRDHFIHRWFHEGAWPGDMDSEACEAFTRQLLAVQLWLQRAERNVLVIFERADLIELTRFEEGFLMMNKDVLDLFGAEDTNEPEVDLIG
jgi:hypothetical protein